MFGMQKPLVEISEPDLQAAIEHLKTWSHNHATPHNQWGREWFIQLIRDALGDINLSKIGTEHLLQIGPGLWMLIQSTELDTAKASPFHSSADKADKSQREHKLQAYILTRTVAANADETCTVLYPRPFAS
jgi:hypothetical protein